MQPHAALDEALFDHILPENLPAALTLKDAGLAERLASSRLLKESVRARVLSSLPALPEALPAESAELFAELSMTTADALERLCRVMAVLINHRAILATTSGAVLTQIAAWCGGRALILGLQDRSFPVFANFHVLKTVSSGELELYAQTVKDHLVGLLPPAYRARLKLRLAPADFPEPRAFAPGDPDAVYFLRYAIMARECRHAED